MANAAEIPSIRPAWLWRGGQILLVGALLLGMAAMLWLASQSALLIPVVPALVLVAVAGWYLFQFPLLNLCVVLGAFVLISSHEAGFQLTEIVYGLYYMGYLAHWYLSRFFFYEDRVLQTPEDRVMLFFLIGITLSFPLTVLFGGGLTKMVSEWVAMIMIGFYFPIKEACERYPNGTRWIVGVVLWIGLFAFFRNILIYRAALNNAVYAWQVFKGRVPLNDIVMMVTTVFALVLLLHAQRHRARLGYLGGFLIFLIGLVLSQSRGFWAGLLFAMLALFVLLPPKYRMRMFQLGLLGFGIAIAGAIILLGDRVFLVLDGLSTRFLSILPALINDPSMLNRYLEAGAVWEHIKANPILGHGMGVPFDFFDITWKYTQSRPFVHNGYVSLWYQFGLWGLLSVLFVWGRTIWGGLWAYRHLPRTHPVGLAGLCAATALIGLLLPANTSNPFFLSDSTIMFGILTGLAAGARSRARTLITAGDA